MTQQKGRITSIFYYPVKSCRGIAAQSVDIGERGIVHDRYWVVANPGGKAVTQRDFPNMALIETSVDEAGSLTLKCPNRGDFTVRPGIATESTKVYVWGTECGGIDEGDEAAHWLSEYLGAPCRLVRVADDNNRQCKEPLPDGRSVKITFVDGVSFLVISEESMDDLNTRLPESLSIKRFRPNIVISGLGPFSEDRSDQLQIGDMSFYKVDHCERCVVTTIDPDSATKGVEPLKTLNTYRRVDDAVIFGTYFQHSKLGRISIGDEVVAIEDCKALPY